MIDHQVHLIEQEFVQQHLLLLNLVVLEMENYQDDQYLMFLIVKQDLQQVFEQFLVMYIPKMNHYIPLMNKDDNLKDKIINRN
jgi:hypothetical protein